MKKLVPYHVYSKPGSSCSHSNICTSSCCRKIETMFCELPKYGSRNSILWRREPMKYPPGVCLLTVFLVSGEDSDHAANLQTTWDGFLKSWVLKKTGWDVHQAWGDIVWNCIWIVIYTWNCRQSKVDESNPHGRLAFGFFCPRPEMTSSIESFYKFDVRLAVKLQPLSNYIHQLEKSSLHYSDL